MPPNHPVFSEFHAISAFSFLRGASQPEALVARAASLGYPAIAITDHGGFYGSARAHSAKGGWKNRWFQMVYSIINAQRLTWDQTNHDPKWESVTPAENQS